ncbi:MAG: PLP-dependent aminotransferase family protein [Planctomycetota bacterium]
MRRSATIRRSDWAPNLSGCEGPLFEAIARCIAEDIDEGRLSVGDHLPTQRALAERIGMDVTTVARGYAEAARVGLVEARVGAGTFVRSSRGRSSFGDRRTDLADRSMNQPPDVQDAGLVARMQRSMEGLGDSLHQLLRYQPSGGVTQDKAAITDWLTRRGILVDRHSLLITAGAHAAISAVLSVLLQPGDCIACESITYPGLRKIAKTLRASLHGLPHDAHGIDPAALDSAIRRRNVRALYLNPTIRNPTTETIPLARRAEIIQVARRHGVAIIEDDAYGFLPVNPPPAMAMMAPELTYYITGLAKCLGPGLRIAGLLTPNEMGIDDVADSLRAVSVMASPITSALASAWINSGLADAVLADIRAESRARRRLLLEAIPQEFVQSTDYAFHAWVTLPESLRCHEVVNLTRGYALGAVAADEFCVGDETPNAFRLCLGGPATREEACRAIDVIAAALEPITTGS